MELALHAHPTLVQYRYPGSGTSRDTLGRYLTPRGEPDTLELSGIKQPCEGGEGLKKSYQSTLVIIHESAPPCTRPASSSLLHWGVGNKHFGAYLGAPPVRLVQLQLQCSTEPCTPVCLFPLTLGIHSSTVACSGSNKSPPPVYPRHQQRAPRPHAMQGSVCWQLDNHAVVVYLELCGMDNTRTSWARTPALRRRGMPTLMQTRVGYKAQRRSKSQCGWNAGMPRRPGGGIDLGGANVEDTGSVS